MNESRRAFLRVAAPAVALPFVEVPAPLQAKEPHLVSREEIMDAFRFFDRMELAAEDLNLRYQILIDMLFETNPEKLRIRLQELKDNRKKRSVVMDVDTGQTALYDSAMYDDLGHVVESKLKKLEPKKVPFLPKISLRYRIASWLMGLRA